MPRAALALWEGSHHICRHADEAFRSTIDFDPEGIPAREAFPDQDAAQDAMDQAFRSGRTVLFRHLDADLLIEPVWHDGRVWGLATCWQPRRSEMPTRVLAMT